MYSNYSSSIRSPMSRHATSGRSSTIITSPIGRPGLSKGLGGRGSESEPTLRSSPSNLFAVVSTSFRVTSEGTTVTSDAGAPLRPVEQTARFKRNDLQRSMPAWLHSRAINPTTSGKSGLTSSHSASPSCLSLGVLPRQKDDGLSPTTILVSIPFLFYHRRKRLHQAIDGQRNLISRETPRALPIPGRVPISSFDRRFEHRHDSIADLCFVLPQCTGNLACTELL